MLLSNFPAHTLRNKRVREDSGHDGSIYLPAEKWRTKCSEAITAAIGPFRFQVAGTCHSLLIAGKGYMVEARCVCAIQYCGWA